MGDAGALRTVIAADGQLPGGCYRRAWEIVNVTETEHAKYVAEVTE